VENAKDEKGGQVSRLVAQAMLKVKGVNFSKPGSLSHGVQAMILFRLAHSW
jgi:hypothetical protein